MGQRMEQITGQMVFPDKLKQGDTVGLIAPSFPVKEEERDDCVKLLEKMGYRVKLGRCLEKLYNFHNYLAGDARERGGDVNRMFADPEVRAVFCVRGGYGCSQIMKYLDFGLIRRNPKILVGYSDITNLHSALQMFGGMVTFHGPMVCSNMRRDFDPYTRESLYAALNMEDELEFKNPPGEEGFKTIRGGKAEGILAGGNLSVLARGCGAFFQLDTKGKILFLEDVEEGIARLDMYITQMEYAGMFDHAAGILLGDFTDCTHDRYDGSYRIEEFLHDRFGRMELPVMCHVRSGHDKPMGTLPFGTLCRMDGDDGRICCYRQKG